MGNSDELIRQYGLLLVFGSVLVEQLGLPIPSIPVLLLAGAASGRGDISFTAALMAKELINQGFQKVRPLKGGLDAWREAGYPIEGVEITSIAQRGISKEGSCFQLD